ncbi:MAG TPA: hypothetical protein DIC42_04930 [Holosporales bacterium]|nr:hypothetical protein [Holosporales bacterium]
MFRFFKNKFFLVTTLFFSIQFSPSVFVFAEVQAVKTELEVKKILDKTTDKTLIFFDIDYLLLQPEKDFLQMGALKHHNEVVSWNLNRLSPSEQDVVVSAMLALEPSVVLSPELIKKIAILKKKKRTLIGISSELTAPVDLAEKKSISMMEEKLQKLKKYGIHFLGPNETITFDNIPENKGSRPVYKQGIIFTNGERTPRGDIIKNFLEKIKTAEKFDSVVYIDDKQANCNEVYEEFSKLEKPQFKKITVLYFNKALLFPEKQMETVPFERKFIEFIRSTKTVTP